MHGLTDPTLRDCINKCWACRDTLQSTLFNYCLQQGGEHARADHVRLMTDAVQMCQTSADFMTRGSKMHPSVCNTCAAVCEACARSCDDFDDQEMKVCADTCRACAESCWDMARHAGLHA